MTELLPCPFCGHVPRQDNLMDSLHPVNHERTLWTFSCLDNEGGCNASVLGDSEEDVIERWNTRFFGGSCQVTNPHQRVFNDPAQSAQIDNDPASTKPKRRKRG